MARKMNDPELEAQKKKITDLAIEIQGMIERGEDAEAKKLKLFKLVQPCALALSLTDRYSVFIKALGLFDGTRNDNFFKFFMTYANYKKINSQYESIIKGGDTFTRRAILNENYEQIVNS